MSEEYLTGRRAGVTGTYGEKRKGGVERTAIRQGEEEGGDLASVAGSIYKKAVSNGGGSNTGGDTALTSR